MTLPTRDQLHEEVDRQFFAAHPGAPARLDPDDPAHARLIDDWIDRRDTILNAWVNDVFFRFFPHAGKLDPSDSADAILIEYWLDIRDAIRDGTPSRYDWSADPSSADDASAVADASQTPPAAVTGGPDPAVFDQLQQALLDDLRSLIETNSMDPDNSEAVRHIREWLGVARSMYLGGYFANDDEWTSPLATFWEGTGFTDFGLQLRVVGAQRGLRMGLVGTGPSDVGGWERYDGAPTQ